jgi:hypothetical protein
MRRDVGVVWFVTAVSATGVGSAAGTRGRVCNT